MLVYVNKPASLFKTAFEIDQKAAKGEKIRILGQVPNAHLALDLAFLLNRRFRFSPPSGAKIYTDKRRRPHRPTLEVTVRAL